MVSVGLKKECQVTDNLTLLPMSFYMPGLIFGPDSELYRNYLVDFPV